MKKILLLFLVIIGMIFTCVCPASVYAVEAAHWSKSPIKVYIPQKNTNSAMVKRAFLKWQNNSYGKLKFTFVDNGPADIDVVFVESANSDCPIASYSMLTENLDIKKAEIKLATESKDIKKYSKDYVYTVVLHEIGHTLGLSDNYRKRTSIMYSPVSEKQDIVKTDLMRLFKINSWGWAQKTHQ